MLELVKSISDLKKLDVKQLPELCADIRKQLIEDVTITGGHLASNLGAVELTVALHYVFDQTDKIVWDVGHQSYVHKILTNRGDELRSLRQKDGISGFPDCAESETDCFNTGHAGTAISAALGLAKARDTQGEHYNVVAVVGDGSMTCGLTYEALNNVKDTNMLIVLNDNNMSISGNVGSATLNMSKIRVGKYDENKERLKRNLQRIPLIGKPTYRFLRWCKRRAKLKFVRNSYFDIFNLKYLGIVDGNEIKDLVYYFTKIKNNVRKPTVLHIITKKGKGFAPAENDPESFHSVLPQDSRSVGVMESSVVVGDTLTKLATERNDVVAVCAAMAKATGLDKFKDVYPDRFYDVGIAESHAVTFAGGLAKGGAKPYVAIYSTFLQRSYDQILHDVALQNLPVTFLIDRAGFVGADGKTHQGLFDLSYLNQIPNLKIWTPSTYQQLSQMILASADEPCPIAVRYAKTLDVTERGFCGKWNVVKRCDNAKLVVLAVGSRMLDVVMQQTLDGIEVVDVTTVKPLDYDYLDNLSSDVKILTLEENVAYGGFGEAVLTYMSQKGKTNVVRIMAAPDNFIPHATVAEQLAMCGLDVEGVSKVIKELLQ
ncbi:MAG: 1-deoxy-D-xylulose-5-phosphate synthase [Clostridia bacterium]|nr:1-deoxy-D-xylulose-5-phosphate synthase [Clostridia bacterium]